MGQCEPNTHYRLTFCFLKWSNSRKSASVKTNKETFEKNLESGRENLGYRSDEPRTASEWSVGQREDPEGHVEEEVASPAPVVQASGLSHSWSLFFGYFSEEEISELGVF